MDELSQEQIQKIATECNRLYSDKHDVLECKYEKQREIRSDGHQESYSSNRIYSYTSGVPVKPDSSSSTGLYAGLSLVFIIVLIGSILAYSLIKKRKKAD